MEMFVPRLNCSLCGSSKAQTVLSRSFKDPSVWTFLSSYYPGILPESWFNTAIYEIRKCEICGFLWQTNILNDRGMGELYGIWISSEDSFNKKTKSGKSPEALYDREMALIGAIFQNKKPQDIQVLDFGMGWGFWCIAAKSAGYSVKGLEIAEDRVAYARSRGVEVIEELSHHQFDFVNAEQVFEHLPDPMDAIRAIVKALKPEGVVRIAVPDGTGADQALKQSDWQAGKDALHPLEHINCYDRGTLTELGKQAGLQVMHPPIPLHSDPGTVARAVVSHVRRRVKGTTFYYRKVG